MTTTAQFDFDLFRLTKSKSVVDIAPGTLKTWNKADPEALPFYRRGTMVFVSKSDLEKLIKGVKKV